MVCLSTLYYQRENLWRCVDRSWETRCEKNDVWKVDCQKPRTLDRMMVACAEIWGKRGSMKLFFHIKTNALFMNLLSYDFREALPRRKPSCASSSILYIGRSVLIELCRFIVVGTNWSSSTSGEASVIIPASSKFKSLSLGRESLSRSTWSFSHCSDLMLRLFLTCLLCWLLFCLLPLLFSSYS